jgi:tetraacyldisaccharide 4'-kinase
VLLVTGIANPKPLQEKLEKEFKKVHCLPYKDHHYFSFDDLNEMNDAFNHIATSNKIIITTEKDAARLMLLKDKILEMNLPFYAQAISIHFLFNEGEIFNEKVKSFVAPFYPIIEEVVFIEEEEVDLNYEEIM